MSATPQRAADLPLGSVVASAANAFFKTGGTEPWAVTGFANWCWPDADIDELLRSGGGTILRPDGLASRVNEAAEELENRARSAATPEARAAYLDAAATVRRCVP